MEEFELEPGETITRSVRTHWIELVLDLLPFVLLALLPLLVFATMPALLSYLNASPSGHIISTSIIQNIAVNSAWIRLLVASWWLFLWISIFSIYTRYCLTQWIITTTRIVDIHQYGFFSRKVSSFLLNRVQDVTTDVEGFLPTVFSYGTLNVETGGREEKFQMRNIANPTELRDLIMKEIADLKVPATGLT